MLVLQSGDAVSRIRNESLYLSRQRHNRSTGIVAVTSVNHQKNKNLVLK